jgi:glucose/mannose transport system substrate-binding protein
MGDWAKGEFTKAGKKPGTDFVCGRFPGTEGSVAFNADQFAVFEVGADKRKAQLALATAVEDVNFQSAFNVVKGSAPARTDVPSTAFDECGKKAIADLAAADKNGSLLGSFSQSHAQPTAIKNAMFDVITRQFNGQLTADQAVEELSSAIDMAK